MLKQNNFVEDLKFGNSYELKALKYLDYDTYEMNNDSRYDILTTKDGIITKYEVKTDRNSWNSGTLLVEYAYRGNPSGIYKTEADYFIFISAYIGMENYYKIPLDELKEIVMGCSLLTGGDRNFSEMFVVPIPKVANYLINFPIKGYDYYISGRMEEVKHKSYSVRMKEYVSEKLITSMKEEEITLIGGLIDEFAKLEYEAKKASKNVIPFGKYKYKTVKEVLAFDRKYLEWFIKQTYSSEYPALKAEIESMLK